jgi:septal ring factor EnvC (AmiA/AmiB activator)
LRSAYAAGRHERLRILFAPEKVGRIQRALAYHRYLQDDRLERIETLRAQLQALLVVQERIETARKALESARGQRAEELAELERQRAQREAVVAAIDARLADAAARIAALGKDERGLLSLLDRLRDAIGDIPRLLRGGEPFASLRGRIPWPLPGRVIEGFGAVTAGGRVSEGVLIEARQGAAVRAVSHGRVAFADWLQGYGMLLIVDHGDGYMSLYAHNEALLRDVGDWVDAGDPIARAGRSGGQRASGAYFEIRAQGRPQDPARWLSRQP